MLIPQPLPAAFTSQAFWVVTGGKRRRVFSDSRSSVSGASHIVQSWIAEAIRKEAQPVLNGDSKQKIDPLQKAPIRLNIPLAQENVVPVSSKNTNLAKEVSQHLSFILYPVPFPRIYLDLNVFINCKV